MKRSRGKVRGTRSDLKTAAKMLALLKTGKDQRVGLIHRVKRAIDSRHYENNLKLEVAVDRLLRDLNRPRWVRATKK
jgi:hypothetical protein